MYFQNLESLKSYFRDMSGPIDLGPEEAELVQNCMTDVAIKLGELCL